MYETVSDLQMIANDHAQAKQDHTVLVDQLHFDKDGTVSTRYGMEQFEGGRFKVHSFGALLGYMKGSSKHPIAPNISRARAYLQEDCPPDMMAAQMNHWLRQMNQNRKLLLRQITPGIDGIDYGRYEGGLHIRHVASDRYSVVDAHHILSWLAECFHQSPYKLGHCHIGIDKIHLRILLPDLDTVIGDEDLGGGHHSFGLYISNGEIGNGRYVISLFMQRNACRNSTNFLLDNYGATLTHRFVSQEQAMHFTVDTVLHLLQEESLITHVKDRILAATRTAVRNPGVTIANILRNRGLSQEYEPFIKGEAARYGSTQAGIANGFNWLAHQAHKVDVTVDEDERAKMEGVAGEILMTPADIFFRNIANVKRLEVTEAGS